MITEVNSASWTKVVTLTNDNKQQSDDNTTKNKQITTKVVALTNDNKQQVIDERTTKEQVKTQIQQKMTI